MKKMYYFCNVWLEKLGSSNFLSFRILYYKILTIPNISSTSTLRLQCKITRDIEQRRVVSSQTGYTIKWRCFKSNVLILPLDYSICFSYSSYNSWLYSSYTRCFSAVLVDCISSLSVVSFGLL